MNRRPYTMLALIAVIVGLALWINLNDTIRILNPFDGSTLFQRDVSPRLGLDLRGGLQVLLEADLPEGSVTAEDMEVARSILENRTNALGVNESSLQISGIRIIGEYPGLEQDTEEIIRIIQQTGLLEFVHMGYNPPTDLSQPIKTNFGEQENAPEADPDATATPTPEGDPATAEVVYPTVMTGRELRSVSVGANDFGQPHIEFVLTDEGRRIFAEYTRAHQGQYLAIVLDKYVISLPVVESAIEEGTGIISGNFNRESANALAVQLRYGSLPIPLKIVESRVVGPTLGQDSLTKSLIAGLVGITIVMLFMGIFYRLPGMLANVSILVYGLIAFAIFKYIPVTLTLAGVAGFLLSTGSALDANILIFERLKEELRGGKTLRQAVDLAFTRAWSSIRDSNLATIITSVILFWFGSAFGASIVKGFALTLSIGVGISLFTAIVVTRTLLNLVVTLTKPGEENPRWFGI
jgi:preprotein translocase subunit SecD